MSNIGWDAAQTRESARHSDGKFGEQHKTDPGQLSLPTAPPHPSDEVVQQAWDQGWTAARRRAVLAEQAKLRVDLTVSRDDPDVYWMGLSRPGQTRQAFQVFAGPGGAAPNRLDALRQVCADCEDADDEFFAVDFDDEDGPRMRTLTAEQVAHHRQKMRAADRLRKVLGDWYQPIVYGNHPDGSFPRLNG